MPKIIAIVEDEPALRENYSAALRAQGYHTQMFATRKEALDGFRKRLPDLILLDIGLTGDADGGFEVCREVRMLSVTVPVIFLSARDTDLDIISGLRLGADDYLTKDISLPHLTARISALFRRLEALKTPSVQENIIERGLLSIDVNRYAVRWRGRTVDLTLTEFWMVHALALHPGHVKNREQLMRDAQIVVDDATITSHVKRMRGKFVAVDPQFTGIDTVYGMGYRWLDHTAE
ncbi:MAG: proteobacterial dedicated sortase system response regulator [Gammaproteobacteria bacterium]|nr:proteobacterial dedicated sortase system response regulator [Gammaproteobacteria bacterium]